VCPNAHEHREGARCSKVRCSSSSVEGESASRNGRSATAQAGVTPVGSSAAASQTSKTDRSARTRTRPRPPRPTNPTQPGLCRTRRGLPHAEQRAAGHDGEAALAGQQGDRHVRKPADPRADLAGDRGVADERPGRRQAPDCVLCCSSLSCLRRGCVARPPTLWLFSRQSRSTRLRLTRQPSSRSSDQILRAPSVDAPPRARSSTPRAATRTRAASSPTLRRAMLPDQLARPTLRHLGPTHQIADSVTAARQAHQVHRFRCRGIEYPAPGSATIFFSRCFFAPTPSTACASSFNAPY
jgi:hypothetical protein